MAKLEGTNLEGANLIGALNLSIDQLSKVRVLYNVKLDEEFLIQLKEEFPFLFKSLKQQFLESQRNLLET
jgi:BTB/POZ domain-containing protein KCTD9